MEQLPAHHSNKQTNKLSLNQVAVLFVFKKGTGALIVFIMYDQVYIVRTVIMSFQKSGRNADEDAVIAYVLASV